MGRNISLQEASGRWVKNSFRSYLEGEKNLRWITGILKGADKAELRGLFDSFSNHGLEERRREIKDWIDKQI